jgi:hypothetical protein
MATKTRTAEVADRTAGEVMRTAVETLGDATAEVEHLLGTALAATEAGVRATDAALRQRSDASLGLLEAYSVGLTTGLLLAGANRILVAVSLIPAALVGGVMLERVNRPRPRR